MALDFSGIYGEVFARGFTYLNDAGAGLARVKRLINDEMHAVDDLELWDYRRTSATGTSPLSSITDLGHIEKVLDTTNATTLAPISLGEALELDGSLATTGTASYYYLAAGVITAYPVTTASLTAYYFKVRADLSGSTDTPLMPDRFRPVIVERVCARLYRDKDNWEAASYCLAEADRMVDQMREFYVLQPGAQHVPVRGFSGDW